MQALEINGQNGAFHGRIFIGMCVMCHVEWIEMERMRKHFTPKMLMSFTVNYSILLCSERN